MVPERADRGRGSRGPGSDGVADDRDASAPKRECRRSRQRDAGPIHSRRRRMRRTGWGRMIRGASGLWKCDEESAWRAKTTKNRKARRRTRRSTAPGMTRREAMLQLLRVGGVAAGAAGAGVWLSERSSRPVPGTGRAGAARSSRGCRRAVAADDGCSRRRATGAGRAGDCESWRMGGSSASRTWWC